MLKNPLFILYLNQRIFIDMKVGAMSTRQGHKQAQWFSIIKEVQFNVLIVKYQAMNIRTFDHYARYEDITYHMN